MYLHSTERIIQALYNNDGLVTRAAREVGCDPDTIWKRAKKVKAVQQAIDKSREGIIDEAETQLFQAVRAGERWAVNFALATIGKSRGYTKRKEVGFTGDVDITVSWGDPDADDQSDAADSS